MIVLVKKNSQYVELTGLKDQSVAPNTYVNDAVLLGTLFDATGLAVAGLTASVGTYQAGTNGVYRFAVSSPSTFDPPEQVAIFVIDGSSGGRALHLELPARIEVRRS